MEYNPIYVRNGIYKLKDGSKDKNLILIHGLNGDGDFGTENDHMKLLYEEIEKYPEIKNYTVWSLKYSSVLVPFATSAVWLYDELKKIEHYNFKDSIVVGYSMGGLIGRAFTALGFDYKYLITIDTPHHGPFSHFTFGLYFFDMLKHLYRYTALTFIDEYIWDKLGEGVSSLKWGSPDHNFIHYSELDKKKRETSYAFYGIDYKTKDDSEYKGHDNTVPIHSQLGLEAGSVRWRYLWKKEYGAGEAQPNSHEPHTVASNPAYCKEALSLLKELLKDNSTMPELKIGDTPKSSKALIYEAPKGQLPFGVDNIELYYFFANDNKAYLKLRCELENTSAKPLEIKLDKLISDSNLGDFISGESVNSLVLTPKSKRTIKLKRNMGLSGLLPEKLSAYVAGSKVEVPIIYVPLPLTPESNVPKESSWEIKIVNATAKSITKEEHYERVVAEFEIINESTNDYELNSWSIIGKIDTSKDLGSLQTNGDVYSWLGGYKFQTIDANSTKKLLLSFTFNNASKRPQILELIIGSEFMPACKTKINIV